MGRKKKGKAVPPPAEPGRRIKKDQKAIPRRSARRAAATVRTGTRKSEHVPAASLTADVTPARGRSFPIVGIGASAGGLDAFKHLLGSLPERTGMAYVVVQHMAPRHESMLTEILSRTSRIPVAEARDGMAVRPDQVYIIPPNADLAILNGKLNLMPRPTTRGPHLPIDYFFRSLAQDRKEKAIGVILSGTASDGAFGTRAIKAEGGITFAQDESSARYPGMPSAAIATGCVDFILPPEKIAVELARIGAHPYVAVKKPVAAREPGRESDEDLNKIYILLRDATGVDFSYYKQATIRRRILRRMVLHKIDRMRHYIRYAQENPAELEALYQDFLINVTSFFRDPETFQALQTKVLPHVLGDKPRPEPVRVWVPGCSTGEEAYSIGICLLEALREHTSASPFHIFATDIDDAALDIARTGIYPESIGQDMSAERLQRFFVKTEQGYKIGKSIREMCVFAKQNLAKDPPFSKLDLISCRNVLIYLKPALQKKLIPIFHYALKTNGYLWLGSSEGIGEFAHLFGVVSRKHKIYSKKSTQLRPPIDFSLPPRYEAGKTPARKRAVEYPVSLESVQKDADKIVLARFAPPGVVINEQMEILQFRGETGPYLTPAPGTASLNLMKMAREGLAPGLRAAIQKAIRENGPVVKDEIRIRRNGQGKEVRIEVVPINPSTAKESFFLVLFGEAAPQDPPPRSGRKGGARNAGGRVEARNQQEDHIRHLEHEIAATKEYLQSVIEEQESTNEELLAANEEIQSSNEELQSTNEELETAKEELQSTNEELTTVNEELGNRNAELALANFEMINFLESVDVPLVMVGTDLHIQRFTPNASKSLNLIPTDTGRHIGDINPGINVPALDRKIRDVIESLVSKDEVVVDHKGRHHILRIRPFRTAGQKIEGAVVSLINIDEIRRTQEQLKESQELHRYANAIVETVRDPLLVLDADLNVKSANRSFYRTFHTGPKETEGKSLFAIGNRQWDTPRFRELMENILPHKTEVHDFEAEYDIPRIGPRRFIVDARRIEGEDASPQLILLAFREDTVP